MLKESILAAATTLTPWHGDVETEQERRERLDTIATAIAEAVEIATCSLPGEVGDSGKAGKANKGERERPVSEESKEEEERCRPMWRGDPRVLAFLLLGQAYFETRLAEHIHAGRCRTKLGECDGGKAISLWQLQSGSHLPKERWKTLSGTDLASTRWAALEAARIVGRSHNFCGSMSGAIALYATGKSCKWSPARKRARFVRSLIRQY